MEISNLQARIGLVKEKRESLLRLLEQPDLGTLRIDVSQSLDELDELIDEFQETFPPEPE